MPTVTIDRATPAMMQTTQNILMIEPVSFVYNEETAETNYFQAKTSSAQPKALAEFKALVALLKENGVNVITIQDSLLPHTPNSIFPSSAVSFHENGRAFIYPMCAENRRQEMHHDILYAVKGKGFVLKEIFDMRPVADSNCFLEGAGSMVFDRMNKVAYACHSERTHEEWFQKTAKRLKYRPMYFNASHNFQWKRLPIYHTDMMLSIAETFVIVCLAAIDDDKQKELLLDELQRTGKEIIEITEKQLQRFVGNAKQLRTKHADNRQVLVMSSNAYDSLTSEQIRRIETHCPIIHSDLSTIEATAGGSVACMMAEIFLPIRNKVTVTATVKSKNTTN